jgi:hypothetical protein
VGGEGLLLDDERDVAVLVIEVESADVLGEKVRVLDLGPILSFFKYFRRKMAFYD